MMPDSIESWNKKDEPGLAHPQMGTLISDSVITGRL